MKVKAGWTVSDMAGVNYMETASTKAVGACTGLLSDSR